MIQYVVEKEGKYMRFDLEGFLFPKKADASEIELWPDSRLFKVNLLKLSILAFLGLLNNERFGLCSLNVISHFFNLSI